jgi:hypothetical protein
MLKTLKSKEDWRSLGELRSPGQPMAAVPT